MGTLEVIGAIFMILSSLFIMVAVTLLESPRDGGLSSLGAGSSDSYFSKNMGRTRDAKLNGLVKVSGTVFFILTILVYAVTK